MRLSSNLVNFGMSSLNSKNADLTNTAMTACSLGSHADKFCEKMCDDIV